MCVCVYIYAYACLITFAYFTADLLWNNKEYYEIYTVILSRNREAMVVATNHTFCGRVTNVIRILLYGHFQLHTYIQALNFSFTLLKIELVGLQRIIRTLTTKQL